MKRTLISIFLLAVMVLGFAATTMASAAEQMAVAEQEGIGRSICFHSYQHKTTYTMHTKKSGQCYYIVYVYTYCSVCQATLGSVKASETPCYAH